MSAAIAQNPAASPSMPSMKLTMLAIATIHSTVTSVPTTTQVEDAQHRQRDVVDRMPKDTGIDAIATRPAIFTPGCSGRMSSNAPRPTSAWRPHDPPEPVMWPSASAGITIAQSNRQSARAAASAARAAAGRRWARRPRRTAMPPATPPGEQHRQQAMHHEADAGRLVVDQPAVHCWPAYPRRGRLRMAPRGARSTYLVPYSRSPASPSPGRM